MSDKKYCWEIGFTSQYARCIKHELIRETNLFIVVKSGLGERRIKKHSQGWAVFTDRSEARSYYANVLKREIKACENRIENNKNELEKWGLE